MHTKQVFFPIFDLRLVFTWQAFSIRLKQRLVLLGFVLQQDRRHDLFLGWCWCVAVLALLFFSLFLCLHHHQQWAAETL